jgi:hypothetical protein
MTTDPALRAHLEWALQALHDEAPIGAYADHVAAARAALAAAEAAPPTPFSSTSATAYLRDALDHWLRNGSSIEAADDLRTAAAEWLHDIEEGDRHG